MSTILDNQNNKSKCQHFTPGGLIAVMLREIEYTENLYGKKVLENSFGNGNILISIVQRYIEDSVINGYTSKEIAAGLQRDIYGFELDKELYTECVKSLNEVLHKNKIGKVKWNLYNDDFLKWNSKITFEFIIGNPPYITYRDIDSANRDFLKNAFNSCKKGKFDYYYAFIEKAVSMLSDNGRIIQLVPSNVYKNVFAQELRNIIKPTICKVFDYPNKNNFAGALTTSTIFMCDKALDNPFFLYYNDTTNEFKKILKSDLSEKWTFGQAEHFAENKIRFGDVFNASVTVATLFNSAFVINPKDRINNNIEHMVVRKTTSPKNMRYNRKEEIIFPYSFRKGKLKHYSCEDFESKFPNACSHLGRYMEELLNRKKDKKAQWFEYGRSQALSHLNQNKLLLSTIITNEVIVYPLDKKTIPYSGIYVVSKNLGYSLEDAKRVLESQEFYDYIIQRGVNLNGNSYRISCKDINDYRF